MSTGLSIVKATYGAGSSSVDVTNVVSSLVKDGKLYFNVSPTSLNVDDPAPGQLKQVNITYTINGGRNNTLTEKDNGVVQIDAPPARLADGLQITKAEYGYTGNFTDVTDAVQNLISNGAISIRSVSHKEVGIPDPNPSKKKQLSVSYTINGVPSTMTIDDGKPFKLSAPPVESPSNSKPSDNVGSAIGIIFKNIALFFGVALHSLSVFASIDYGNQFVSPIIWGGLAFFLPFFSFWALPVITFIVRLFKSSDFIVNKAKDAMPAVVKAVTA